MIDLHEPIEVQLGRLEGPVDTPKMERRPATAQRRTEMWEFNGQKITLPMVQRFIAWHRLIAKPMSVSELLPLATAKNEARPGPTSDGQKPIIVIARNEKPLMILDGHHRVQRAARVNETRIAGYIIDIRLVPPEWRTAIAS